MKWNYRRLGFYDFNLCFLFFRRIFIIRNVFNSRNGSCICAECCAVYGWSNNPKVSLLAYMHSNAVGIRSQRLS